MQLACFVSLLGPCSVWLYLTLQVRLYPTPLWMHEIKSTFKNHEMNRFQMIYAAFMKRLRKAFQRRWTAGAAIVEKFKTKQVKK